MKCEFWLLQMVPRDSDIASIKSARSIYYLHHSTLRDQLQKHLWISQHLSASLVIEVTRTI